LPPLFLVWRAEFDVSFAMLGASLAPLDTTLEAEEARRNSFGAELLFARASSPLGALGDDVPALQGLRLAAYAFLAATASEGDLAAARALRAARAATAVAPPAAAPASSSHSPPG
jgi:hypothetical protein